MICYGVVTAVSAMCLGYIGKHIKRFPIMSAGKESCFQFRVSRNRIMKIKQANDITKFA